MSNFQGVIGHEALEQRRGPPGGRRPAWVWWSVGSRSMSILNPRVSGRRP
jgi:hypothetical protein